MKKRIIISLILIYCSMLSYGQVDYSEMLIHTTIRIEAMSSRGSSFGTGFFFKYDFKDDITIPVIVTNKHVIKNTEKVKLVFTRKENNAPQYGNKIYTEISTSYFINHPESEIDLAVLPLAFIKNIENAFYQFLNELSIPDKEVLDNLLAIEEVLMIGYPNAIWDKLNNLPVSRRGFTATHPNINYNGKEEFLIDIAAFGGSSGSPILLFDQGSYLTKENIKLGGRIFLLGILYKGPTYTVKGNVVDTIPKNVITPIPMGLACVIKSCKLNDFRAILLKLHSEIKN